MGRPILWGLGVAGEAGVDRVLSILKEELITTMTFCGEFKQIEYVVSFEDMIE